MEKLELFLHFVSYLSHFEEVKARTWVCVECLHPLARISMHHCTGHGMAEVPEVAAATVGGEPVTGSPPNRLSGRDIAAAAAADALVAVAGPLVRPPAPMAIGRR